MERSLAPQIELQRSATGLDDEQRAVGAERVADPPWVVEQHVRQYERAARQCQFVVAADLDRIRKDAQHLPTQPVLQQLVPNALRCNRNDLPIQKLAPLVILEQAALAYAGGVTRTPPTGKEKPRFRGVDL